MGERASVLIVEDNPETRDVLRRVLELQGYTTHAVGNGRDALSWLRAGHRPSAIILDLYMPVMDGDAFLREAKANTALAGIPVVAFTARVGEPPPGLTAFVRKGTDDPDVLLNAIEACLKA